VARVLAHPETVRVDGAERAVAAMARAPTRPIRIVGARAPVRAEVPLEAAPRHAQYLDATTVTVEVDVQPAMAERVFDALPIRVIGLSRLDGQADPPVGRLVLRGPADLVQQVSADTVSLRVDAQLIDLRPPARYLRSVMVSGLPPGVAAEVQPDSVSVTTHRRRD
jgi:hypothetical protein